jgi:hypothetical protein
MDKIEFLDKIFIDKKQPYDIWKVLNMCLNMMTPEQRAGIYSQFCRGVYEVPCNKDKIEPFKE